MPMTYSPEPAPPTSFRSLCVCCESVIMSQSETCREVEREPEQRQLMTQRQQLQQRIDDKQVCT